MPGVPSARSRAPKGPYTTSEYIFCEYLVFFHISTKYHENNSISSLAENIASIVNTVPIIFLLIPTEYGLRETYQDFSALEHTYSSDVLTYS